MKTIVIGSLNTDLVVTGIEKFPKSGEHVYGKELLISAGGKSRNIADMIAHLTPINSVAMIGKTVKDPYGLWKVPMDALSKVGVNTDYVNVLEYDEVQKLPGIALIPVDKQGHNQIIVLPGISDDFNIADIDNAEPLFEAVGKNNGMLVLTLECPLETASYAVEQARKYGLKVMFDPGGIRAGTKLSELLLRGTYLIKPNEHEARTLTGVEVIDFASARVAAEKLLNRDVENVLITHGSKGAYLFTKIIQQHLTVPKVSVGGEKDETGCGDQTIAALCAFLQDGTSIEEATKNAILAGSLQFHRLGIQPVTRADLVAADSS